MNNRITAQEAFAKAEVEYKNELNKRVEEFLNEVYNKIDKAAEMGEFDISLELSNYSNYHDNVSAMLKAVSAMLKADGYGVTCTYNDYQGHYYMNIHWNGPFT